MSNKYLNFDLKSLIIGFLLAAVAFFAFNGSPSRAQLVDNGFQISAVEDGVYILRDGNVVFREKADCRKAVNCSYYSPGK